MPQHLNFEQDVYVNLRYSVEEFSTFLTSNKIDGNILYQSFVLLTAF